MIARLALVGVAVDAAGKHGQEVAQWTRNHKQFDEATLLGERGAFAGLYACPDAGEAYSAAYLTQVSTFLSFPVAEDRLFKGQANMEGASHAMFKQTALHKTVDLFDFFMQHLSWYERLLGASDAQSLQTEMTRAARAVVRARRPRRRRRARPAAAGGRRRRRRGRRAHARRRRRRDAVHVTQAATRATRR